MTATAKTREVWRKTVFVCRKCSRKVRGGFEPNKRTGLEKALRRELDVAEGRRGKIGVIKAHCFGICPKNSAIATRGQPDRLFIVPAGAPLKNIVAMIGPSNSARDRASQRGGG